MRCGRCGCGKFVFSTRGCRYGNHHGAVCANCHKPMTLTDTPYYAAAGGPVYRRKKKVAQNKSGERPLQSMTAQTKG